MEPPRRDTFVATPPPHLSSLVDTHPVVCSPKVSIASHIISTTSSTHLHTIHEEPPLLLSKRPPKPSYPLPPLRLRGAERWRCQTKPKPHNITRMSNKKKRQRAKRKYKQQQSTLMSSPSAKTVVPKTTFFVDIPLDDDTTTPDTTTENSKKHPQPTPSCTPIDATTDVTDEFEVVCAAEWADTNPDGNHCTSATDESRCVIC